MVVGCFKDVLIVRPLFGEMIHFDGCAYVSNWVGGSTTDRTVLFFHPTSNKNHLIRFASAKYRYIKLYK